MTLDRDATRTAGHAECSWSPKVTASSVMQVAALESYIRSWRGWDDHDTDVIACDVLFKIVDESS